MLIGNISKQAYHTKPLKIVAHSLPDGIKIQSKTVNQDLTITNPLESLLAALTACELSTARGLTHKGKFHIKSINFTRVESGYNIGHFIKGGHDNQIDDVFIEAEVTSNGTQEQLDELEKKVLNSCPVYQMLTAAGVKIHNTWTNIQEIE